LDYEIIKFNFGFMNKKGLVIAIDGFSSTGKSSISKVVADTLGLIHIDTGAMYRAITLFGLRNFKDEKQEIDLSKLLQNLNEISLEFRENSGKLEIYLNGENVSKEIRTTEVSDNVSFIAKQPEVRERLVVLQRDIANLYAQGKLGQKISLADDAGIDTTIDSPYNVYTHLGLMPGPVDSPSSDAIEASVNQTKSEYLYFVANVEDGKVYFATTKEEHDQNVAEHINSKLPQASSSN